MNRKLLATAVALVASTVAAHPFALTFNGWSLSDPPSGFKNAAGEVTDGITAQIVTLSADAATIADDLDAIMAAATVHAEGVSSSDLFGGLASGVATQSAQDVTGIEGDPLYLFAFLGAEWFLGTSDAGNWVGGLDGELSPTVSLDATEVNIVNWGSINEDGGQFIQLEPIPEPSTYALMVAGLAGIFIYFRRRK